MKTSSPFVGALAALSIALGSTSALAQIDTRYAPWTPPQTPQQFQQMLSELDAIVSEAERDRAGDPEFLRDLRALLTRYSAGSPVPPGPVGRLIFSDDFSDGDYTRNPSWNVLVGQWTVQPGVGLRSDARYSSGAPLLGAAPLGLSPQATDIGTIATTIIGNVLQNQGVMPQALQGGQAAQVSGGTAAIEVAQQIPNAFAMDLTLNDRAGAGQLEARVYQTSTREPGYRLVYRPTGLPQLSLYRVSRSGPALLASASGSVPLRNNDAQLRWTRDAQGRMVVTVNGQTVIQVSDTTFRDPWTGFMLANFGGDYSMRRIGVSNNGL